MARHPRTRAQIWLTRGAVAVVLLTGGAAVGWAASTVFAPTPDVVDSTPFTTAEVVSGEVGSSFSVNAVAEWEPVPAASNLAAGTVTSVVIEPGQSVGQGSVLFAVNLRPVVIATGATPAFRPMARGTKGADVAQLQAMLAELGFYRGAVDGSFGGSTSDAVRAWHRSLGLEADAEVQAGDVVFVPSLPTRVILDAESIMRGASLSGGEAVVSALPATPSFRVPVTAAQAVRMPTDTRVEIDGPDGHDWVGVVVDQQPQKDGDTVDVILAGEDGAPVCGADCASVRVEAESVLPARAVTLEAVSGLTVPSAALLSRADGSIAVIDESGEEHDVTVVASAQGVSVIEGVEAGMKVRIPASGL